MLGHYTNYHRRNVYYKGDGKLVKVAPKRGESGHSLHGNQSCDCWINGEIVSSKRSCVLSRVYLA